MQNAKVSMLHPAANPRRNPALEAAEYLLPSDTAGLGCCAGPCGLSPCPPRLWATPGHHGHPPARCRLVLARCTHSGAGRLRALEKGAWEASTPGVSFWGRHTSHFIQDLFSISPVCPSLTPPASSLFFPFSSSYFKFPSQRKSKTQRFTQAPGSIFLCGLSPAQSGRARRWVHVLVFF